MRVGKTDFKNIPIEEKKSKFWISIYKKETKITALMCLSYYFLQLTVKNLRLQNLSVFKFVFKRNIYKRVVKY